jgi:hypothetical protein
VYNLEVNEHGNQVFSAKQDRGERLND